MKRLMLIYLIEVKAHIFIDLDGSIIYLDPVGNIPKERSYNISQMADYPRFEAIFNESEVGVKTVLPILEGTSVPIDYQRATPIIIRWKSDKLPTIPDLIPTI